MRYSVMHQIFFDVLEPRLTNQLTFNSLNEVINAQVYLDASWGVPRFLCNVAALHGLYVPRQFVRGDTSMQSSRGTR